jgi:hypothetical protein
LFQPDSESHVSMQSSDDESEVQVEICDEVSANDFAVALVLLKKQHRLSIKCMDDLLALLKVLRVSNTPSSWHKAKRLLSELKPTSITHFVCPVCSETTDNEKQCINCSSTHNCRLPFSRSFSITQQIENIIINNDDIDSLHYSKTTALRDLRDGAVFRSLREKSTDRILTLTLNIDGIQPSRNTQSTLWPINMVINELPPQKRFALENIVLAAID